MGAAKQQAMHRCIESIKGMEAALGEILGPESADLIMTKVAELLSIPVSQLVTDCVRHGYQAGRFARSAELAGESDPPQRSQEPETAKPHWVGTITAKRTRH